MGLLRVALRIEFENPVVLVHSWVHPRSTTTKRNDRL